MSCCEKENNGGNNVASNATLPKIKRSKFTKWQIKIVYQQQIPTEVLKFFLQTMEDSSTVVWLSSPHPTPSAELGQDPPTHFTFAILRNTR